VAVSDETAQEIDWILRRVGIDDPRQKLTFDVAQAAR
jgi:hypothetical protein